MIRLDWGEVAIVGSRMEKKENNLKLAHWQLNFN